MLYDMRGTDSSYELSFSCVGDQKLLVVQHDITQRVQQNRALFRIIDLNLGLLAQMYPGNYITDTVGRGERRSSADPMRWPNDFARFSKQHPMVIILFADIVGFTKLCSGLKPAEVMEFLTMLYDNYDYSISRYTALGKLEIVGDCYVAVGGLMKKDVDGFNNNSDSPVTQDAIKGVAVDMLQFALDIHKYASMVVLPHQPQHINLRIGIHCGPVMSGIIGHVATKFMLFGDAMNTASRMESTCPPGHIQVSRDMYALLTDDVDADAKDPAPGWTRNTVDVKGKGVMDTYVRGGGPGGGPVRPRPVEG
jgi:class 3 adenylate cyclase